MSAEPILDWTVGTEAIAVQVCANCRHRQYFRRDFCAACGAHDLTEQRASGRGVVYAVSLVSRAATPEARAHGPYTIVLVEAEEGFRLMAHGAHDLLIGDRVTARFAQFTGHLVPYFERTPA